MKPSVLLCYCRKCGKKLIALSGPAGQIQVKRFRHLNTTIRGYQCQDCNEPDIEEPGKEKKEDMNQ